MYVTLIVFVAVAMITNCVLLSVWFIVDIYMLEVVYASIPVANLSLSFSFIQILFYLMLGLCGFISVNYGLYYLGFFNDFKSNYLFYTMFGFLLTMLALVTTGNLITTLIFWEYLGVVSFFLILYYQNMFGLRASLITLITSRAGDVFLFLLCGYFFYELDSINIGSVLFVSSLVFVVGSKSAFYPMVSWLLEAMRAPTPVSALVHSSTLVAAGVWFVSSYGSILLIPSFTSVGVICCILTVYITFLCSLTIKDVKKIVALSTSNNISWCLIYIFSGYCWLGLIQLLSHGVGKCLYFVVMGDIMSKNDGGQHSAGHYPHNSSFSLVGLFGSVFCLSGLPFLGIYFSKHFFFGDSYSDSSNLLFWLILLGGLLGTNLYSVRLLVICNGLVSGQKYSLENSFIGSLLFLPCMLLFNYCITFGLEEGFENTSLLCFLINISLMVGWVTGGYYFGYGRENGGLSGLPTFFWNSTLGCLDYLVDFFVYSYRWLFWGVSVVLYRWDSFTVMAYYGVLQNTYVVLGLSSFVLLTIYF
uniref:NADH dehydrogenase subunit 5 n=1 Tax=Hexostoma thynni TaxID=92220 RepID=UPI0022371A03|nr:NADH dehydrogenase subunit 5 [Hexostoma thynni]UYC28899.1 NADH dehydrogenase subunit 5 [Hexostoma thynni]